MTGKKLREAGLRRPITVRGPRFVLLNDTRDQPHFGCHCVISNIHGALQARGASIIGAALAGSNWERNHSFLRKLVECDAILINGEGTLHHGNSRAERLLKIVNHSLRGNKPVFLINALYQDNPNSWGRYLNKMALVCARDSRSFGELRKIYQGSLAQAIDLSLYTPLIKPDQARIDRYIIYGDSFYPEISKVLLSLCSAQNDANCIPIMTSIKSRKANLNQPLRFLRDIYIRGHAEFYKFRYSSLTFAADASDYLSRLSTASLHITGRFHGACLSMLTETPVLVVASNSWKVEALVHDLGLSENRIISVEKLKSLRPHEEDLSFSGMELQNIRYALDEGRKNADTVFDQVISAAKSHGNLH